MWVNTTGVGTVRATRRRAAALVAVLALGAFSSCSILAPRPDPTRFFVLSASAARGNPVASDSQLSIGVGPVMIPDYLMRSEIVVRTSATEIRPSQIDFWAEPLDVGFTRVLAQNLSSLLGTERVVSYPAYALTRADWQVTVQVERFEVDAENTATLRVRWAIRERKSQKFVVARETSLTSTATGPHMRDGVAALSTCLTELSETIATTVRQLSGVA